jgi:hypothetical protein
VAVVSEFPPTVLPTFSDLPLNGGRVQSVSVNPARPQQALVANQFGGLWFTPDRGTSWRHVSSLQAVFAVDVAYGPDGEHAVATLGRDAGVVNGGGIYVTSDRGISWQRPATAEPPLSPRVTPRVSAYGISWDRWRSGRIYVGTDHGIAISRDWGATWTHVMLQATSRVTPGRDQNRVMSVLALPDDAAIVTAPSGVYRTDDGGTSWRRVRFTSFAAGFKCIDVNPLDSDKVFILQDYENLWLYEVAADTWSHVALPKDWASRGPFLCVGRATASGSFDIWYGPGALALRRATCASFAAAKALTAASWVTFGRAAGLHDDSGYLGLDPEGRPALFGCDGGIFRPTNSEATTWERAGTGKTGLNSYLITDVAGTNVLSSSSVYFATQDNAIWGSDDAGHTWPYWDCAEGFMIQAPHRAALDQRVTVAYGKLGCGPSPSMFSDANLQNQRAVPDVDESGNAVTGLTQAFFVSPRRWVRFRTPPGGNPEVWTSTNDGNGWRHRATVTLGVAGQFQVTGTLTKPIIWAPFFGARQTADGRSLIGLMRFSSLFPSYLGSMGVPTYGDGGLIYLPEDGSLGVRATEFDWHAIFGADPADPDHVIAPDVHNGVVRVTHDAGTTWTVDHELTDRVTKGGQLLLDGGDAYRTQVTQISFDPYEAGRTLVGTRDAGVVCGYAGGPWQTLADSEPMRYVTGFFFRRNQTVVASTYGRGLWTVDFRVVRGDLPEYLFCRVPCWIRWWDEWRIVPDPPPDRWGWDVLVAIDGGINGIVMDGRQIARISVTPGASFRRFIGHLAGPDFAPIEVVESEEGLGFADVVGARAALEAGEVVNGVLLREGFAWAILSGESEFADDAVQPELRDSRVADDTETVRVDDVKTPYLTLSTSLPIAGIPVVGADRRLFARLRAFEGDEAVLVVTVDGAVVDGIERVRSGNGDLTIIAAIPETLPTGSHTVEVMDGAQKRVLARAQFVTATMDDFEEEHERR